MRFPTVLRSANLSDWAGGRPGLDGGGRVGRLMRRPFGAAGGVGTGDVPRTRSWVFRDVVFQDVGFENDSLLTLNN